MKCIVFFVQVLLSSWGGVSKCGLSRFKTSKRLVLFYTVTISISSKSSEKGFSGLIRIE